MTASTLSQIPLMAGSVLLAHLSKGAQWAFARYMRTPLASTGLLVLVTLSAMAGSNALYMQTSMHPSPFFGPVRGVPQPVVTAPADAPMPAPLSQREQAAEADDIVLPTASPETTGSVQSAPVAVPAEPVGNSEVFAVQKKLAQLGLFEGKVDGYYGPMTARAIRAFEERNGLVPMGALSANVVAAILNSDGSGRMSMAPAAAPAPQQQVAAAPEPAAATLPVAAIAVARVETQPAPQQPAAEQDRVVAQLPPLGPVEQAVDTVGTAAASSIDSIIAAVGGPRETSAPAPVANPPIPTATVPSQPMPAPVAEAAPQVQIAGQATQSSQPRALRPATDKTLVSDIQRGLASLGFFHGAIDGNPGPETSRAIREFENFNRYRITGQVQPDLVDLLRQAGAAI
ncbi:Putative peptidoglycan binding domain-containing protein [Devosia crocina]|uniref:Putative peptidoglycan binding domain-containing protein n=1 Tax=Devosia crocina TaxID=429728 RepID=A0A1I7NMZ2_9HYPH|nr:peptidoglycan-binding domain-containing protein [Devosia crocina]SFV35950.1 Putative peptidoglycan binding domain-containing protein [Devosia crocina]